MILRLSNTPFKLEHLERKTKCALSDARGDSHRDDILKIPEPTRKQVGRPFRVPKETNRITAVQGSESMAMAGTQLVAIFEERLLHRSQYRP